jgi:hypothetical protein
MTKYKRWTDWFRTLVELDRTPEEILSARVDALERQLHEHQSKARNKS